MVFSKKDIELARSRNQRLRNIQAFEEGRMKFKKTSIVAKKELSIGNRLKIIMDRQERKFKRSLDFGKSLR